MDSMFLKFTIADKNGQFAPHIALEVRRVKWHGLTSDNIMLLDVVHMDSTHERLSIKCEPYGDFSIGEREERVIDIVMTTFEYPVMKKDAFHERFGKGLFICPRRKHFVKEEDLLPAYDGV